MTTIKILENKAIIVAGHKAEVIEKIQKFEPAALQLVNEETKDVEFIYLMGKKASLGENGVCFDSVNDAGYPFLWLEVKGETADEKKQFIAEEYGPAIAKINELEAVLAEVARDIDSRLAAVKEAITVVQ